LRTNVDVVNSELQKMISPIRPPFGAGRVAGAILNGPKQPSVEQVEDAYAQACGMPHAVLLPSCRAGISWLLQSCVDKDVPVICPAFTCMVVWESVVRAGLKLKVVDIAEDGFLMDQAALIAAQQTEHALVLCEIYGYTYDLDEITRHSATRPVIRIVDMAMTIPTRKLFERLDDDDFAFISFGSGKTIYAGWGGMGLTRNESLAEMVRQKRNTSVARGDFLLPARRGLKMLALNLLHEPFAYGLLQKYKERRNSVRQQRLGRRTDCRTIYSLAEQPLSKEWFVPTTYIDRRLMLYNLQRLEQYREKRIKSAQRYHHNFEGVAGIGRPETSTEALSHYTIRVNSGSRRLLRRRLWSGGVDAGTHFFFPLSFSRAEYPNAGRTASEVLNLPMDVRLNIGDIDRISDCVVRAAKDLNYAR
jgi:perosamine synthetase